MLINQFNDQVTRLIGEMNKVIIGYPDVKRFSIAGIFSDQHILLEGVPGTAKSLFVEAFQGAIANSASTRIQMTPDVKPMDLVGVKVFDQSIGKYTFEMGPVHAKNFALFDELNRAQGRTLSAVLSSMQERRIFISGIPFTLPDPFFCMATQNPIEQEGVYPLPEAAVDRFGAKVTVPYATAEEEEQILDTPALDQRDPQSCIQTVLDIAEIVRLREEIKKGVYVSPAARQYIVALARATRPGSEQFQAVAAKSKQLQRLVRDPAAVATPQKRGLWSRWFGEEQELPPVDPRIAELAADGFTSSIQAGSSVRGQLAMRGFARVFATLKGRSFVLPEDVQEAMFPVLRHRTTLTFEAISEGYASDQALEIIKEHVPFQKDQNEYLPKSA